MCPTQAACAPSLTRFSDDFWIWQGSGSLTSQSWLNWSVVTKDQPRPSPRAGAMMTLDESRNELVLFGGYGIPPGETMARDLDDTWVFTWVNGWQRINVPTPRPAARDDGAMSFTTPFFQDHVLLFGGYAPLDYPVVSADH
jgi:hypothetical protein